MSEWYSIGTEIRGLDYDTEEPTVTIGLALSWYDVARVGIRPDHGRNDGEGTVLLDAEAMRQLAALLTQAADKLDNTDPALVTNLTKRP